jgi:hypothetical protein
MQDEYEHKSFDGQETGRLGDAVPSSETNKQLPPSKIANTGLSRLNAICAAKNTRVPEVGPSFHKLADTMLVPKTVQMDAIGMYRATFPMLGQLSKSKQVALEAVCLFTACKAATQLKVPKTKEQLCGAFDVELSVFFQVHLMFTDASKDKPWYMLATDTDRATDMLPTILNYVGHTWKQAQKAYITRQVTDMYESIVSSDFFRKRMSHLNVKGILAAMIWMVCADMAGLVGKPSKAELGQLIGITQNTINNNVRLLREASDTVAAPQKQQEQSATV